jgi:hypothetical protein
VALTDDQKAMLRLLAQREEGYEDMAALMGIGVEEVRLRVKEALAEVDESSASVEESPSAPAPPSPPAPAQPQAEEPTPSPPAATPTPTPPATTAKAPRRPAFKRPAAPAGLRLPKDRGALIGLGAGALAVVVLAIVLAVSGGGGSSSTTPASTEVEQGGTNTATSESSKLTQAILSPVGGGDANGVAVFGRLKKEVLLQVTGEGLDPSQAGQSYAVWLAHSGTAMVPVGTAKVPASGDLAARFKVPAAVLVLVARRAFDEIDVTLTSDATLSAAIAKARREKKESAYTGTDVLRGKITGPLLSAPAGGKG